MSAWIELESTLKSVLHPPTQTVLHNLRASIPDPA
jgi:hypothetical protein